MGRAFPAPCDEGFEDRARALRDRLDPAVRQISHPPGEPEPSRGVAGGAPEEDALDEPGNRDVRTFGDQASSFPRRPPTSRASSYSSGVQVPPPITATMVRIPSPPRPGPPPPRRGPPPSRVAAGRTRCRPRRCRAGPGP